MPRRGLHHARSATSRPVTQSCPGGFGRRRALGAVLLLCAGRLGSAQQRQREDGGEEEEEQEQRAGAGAVAAAAVVTFTSGRGGGGRRRVRGPALQVEREQPASQQSGGCSEGAEPTHPIPLPNKASHAAAAAAGPRRLCFAAAPPPAGRACCAAADGAGERPRRADLGTLSLRGAQGGTPVTTKGPCSCAGGGGGGEAKPGWLRREAGRGRGGRDKGKAGDPPPLPGSGTLSCARTRACRPMCAARVSAEQLCVRGEQSRRLCDWAASPVRLVCRRLLSSLCEPLRRAPPPPSPPPPPAAGWR